MLDKFLKKAYNKSIKKQKGSFENVHFYQNYQCLQL